MDYSNLKNPSFQDGQDSDVSQIPSSVRTVEPNRQDSSTETRLFGAYRNTNQDILQLTPVPTPDAPLLTPVDAEFNPSEANILNNETQTPNTTGRDNIIPMNETEDILMNKRAPRVMEPEPERPTIPRMGPETSRPTTPPMGPGPVRTTTPPMGLGSVRTNTPPMGPGPVRPTTTPTEPGPARPRQGIPMPAFTMAVNANAKTMPVRNTLPSNNANTASPMASMPYYQLNQNQNMYLPIRNTPYYNMSTNGYENLTDFEEAERDMEYLQQLYPTMCKIISSEIAEECDKLEYEGSCMFDEYPDRVTIDRIVTRIYNRLKNRDDMQQYLVDSTGSEMSANQVIYNPCPGCNFIEDFARVLFLNEMHNRRRRYRSRRRWFY